MNKKPYIPLLDIYIEDMAVFPNGDVILSYDSFYYCLKEKMWISNDPISEFEHIKQTTVCENGFVVVDEGYCYEYALPIEISGEWILIASEFIEFVVYKQS